MASNLFNSGLLKINNQSIDFVGDDIQVLLVASGYTFDKDHEFVDDITNEVTNASGSGYERKSLSGKSISLTSDVSVSSITRSGSTVTVTLSSAQDLRTGIQILIEGADQSEYNGMHEVTAVNSDTEFEFEVSGTPTSPATGTITFNRQAIVFDADNPTYTAIDTNEDLAAAIVFKQNNDDTDSSLIAQIDFSDLATNGSDVELQVAAGGLFDITNVIAA